MFIFFAGFFWLSLFLEDLYATAFGHYHPRFVYKLYSLIPEEIKIVGGEK